MLTYIRQIPVILLLEMVQARGVEPLSMVLQTSAMTASATLAFIEDVNRNRTEYILLTKTET